MELISFEPKTVKSYFLPYKETRIIPIGDVQYGSTTDVERLKKYLSWGMKQNVYFLGMGDYLDVGSPSNRRVISSLRGSLYDSIRKGFDEKFTGQIDELKDILEPTRGRWLGLLRGHHYWEFEDGTETDSRLAEYLKCPLLGDCGVIILRMRHSPTHGYVDAKIWAHHGPFSASAQLETAPLTRLEHVTKKFYADVYCVGHYHKKGVTVMPWIDYEVGPTGKIRMTGRNRYLVACGAFLRSYEQESVNAMGRPAGGYAEKGMMGPTALGAPMIMLRPVINDGYTRIDINVSV